MESLSESRGTREQVLIPEYFARKLFGISILRIEVGDLNALSLID
jgi:hypothetical protein